MDALWPDEDPVRVRNRLSVAPHVASDPRPGQALRSRHFVRTDQIV